MTLFEPGNSLPKPQASSLTISTATPISKTRYRTLWLLLAAVCLILIPAAQAQITSNSTGLDRGYFDMYDVNFAAAHTVFQQWLAQHPDDSLAAASDAAASESSGCWLRTCWKTVWAAAKLTSYMS